MLLSRLGLIVQVNSTLKVETPVPVLGVGVVFPLQYVCKGKQELATAYIHQFVELYESLSKGDLEQFLHLMDKYEDNYENLETDEYIYSEAREFFKRVVKPNLPA